MRNSHTTTSPLSADWPAARDTEISGAFTAFKRQYPCSDTCSSMNFWTLPGVCDIMAPIGLKHVKDMSSRRAAGADRYDEYESVHTGGRPLSRRKGMVEVGEYAGDPACSGRSRYRADAARACPRSARATTGSSPAIACGCRRSDRSVLCGARRRQKTSEPAGAMGRSALIVQYHRRRPPLTQLERSRTRSRGTPGDPRPPGRLGHGPDGSGVSGPARQCTRRLAPSPAPPRPRGIPPVGGVRLEPAEIANAEAGG